MILRGRLGRLSLVGLVFMLSDNYIKVFLLCVLC